jgi:hypothetical protein
MLIIGSAAVEHLHHLIRSLTAAAKAAGLPAYAFA